MFHKYTLKHGYLREDNRALNSARITLVLIFQALCFIFSCRLLSAAVFHQPTVCNDAHSTSSLRFFFFFSFHSNCSVIVRINMHWNDEREVIRVYTVYQLHDEPRSSFSRCLSSFIWIFFRFCFELLSIVV